MERSCALILAAVILIINFCSLPISTEALLVPTQDTWLAEKSIKCSRTCESKHCTFAPFLRYGKYCGLGYTGCPGEAPCDGLDECCQAHDECVGTNGYLSKKCNGDLLKCVEAFENSGMPQFQGACRLSKVAHTIEHAMRIATILKDQQSQLHGNIGV